MKWVGAVVFFFLIAGVQACEEQEYNVSEFWEETKTGGIIYSYQRNWFNNTICDYEVINESWQKKGKVAKTKEYNFMASLDDSGNMKAEKGLSEFTLQLQKIFNKKLDFKNLLVNDSVATYIDIFPGIDLAYQYLPSMVKEDIIIRDRTSIAPFLEGIGGFILEFNVNKVGGSLDPKFTDLVMCDDELECVPVGLTQIGNKVYLEINATFILQEQLPITIDPTLNFADIDAMGYIRAVSAIPPTYTRTTGRSFYTGRVTSSQVRRSWMDWNVTDVGFLAEVFQNIVLQVHVERNLGVATKTLNMTHMEGNSSFYPNTDPGNNLFYIDMLNGSVFSSISVTGIGKRNLTLNTEGLTDFRDDLRAFSLGVERWFSVGFHSSIAGNPDYLIIASSTSATAANRPILFIENSACFPNQINDWRIQQECYFENRTISNSKNLIVLAGGVVFCVNATLAHTIPYLITVNGPEDAPEGGKIHANSTRGCF